MGVSATPKLTLGAISAGGVVLMSAVGSGAVGSESVISAPAAVFKDGGSCGTGTAIVEASLRGVVDTAGSRGEVLVSFAPVVVTKGSVAGAGSGDELVVEVAGDEDAWLLVLRCVGAGANWPFCLRGFGVFLTLVDCGRMPWARPSAARCSWFLWIVALRSASKSSSGFCCVVPLRPAVAVPSDETRVDDAEEPQLFAGTVAGVPRRAPPGPLAVPFAGGAGVCRKGVGLDLTSVSPTDLPRYIIWSLSRTFAAERPKCQRAIGAGVRHGCTEAAHDELIPRRFKV